MTLQLMHRNARNDLDLGEQRPGHDWSLTEMRAAIAAVLFANARDLDIRLLWLHHPTTCFRVNWWTNSTQDGPRIRGSAFVRVTRLAGGYYVRKEAPTAA